MIANPLNQSPHDAKDGEVAMTYSTISTDSEIVDILFPVVH